MKGSNVTAVAWNQEKIFVKNVLVLNLKDSLQHNKGYSATIMPKKCLKTRKVIFSAAITDAKFLKKKGSTLKNENDGFV